MEPVLNSPKLTGRAKRAARKEARERARAREAAQQEIAKYRQTLEQQREPAGAQQFPAPPWLAPTVGPFGTSPLASQEEVPVETRTSLLDKAESLVLGLGARVRGNWSRRVSTFTVILGLTLVFVSLCVGLAVGAPVLGHAGQPVVAVGGAAGVGVGMFLALKGWRNAGRRIRVVFGSLILLLSTFFTVGVLSGPVIIDGKVFLHTSAEAQSYRLIEKIRNDLLDLSNADAYLTYNPAQAGARYHEYPKLLDKLVSLSNEYALLSGQSESLPDPVFVDVVESTTAAAWWASQALQSKIETLTEENAKSVAALTDRRATYAQSVLTAGNQLRYVAEVLRIPLSQMGPVE